MHSPTEFIAKHNAWDFSRPDVVIAKRLEDYCIAAADGLLCPSHYLARQVEQHYNLAPGAVDVVPYPRGNSQYVSRVDSTWQQGTICFVGRLEPRKGVLEWIDAAIGVARDHPQPVRFDFIGADTIHQGTSVRRLMERRIPPGMRSQFRFLGELRRSQLAKHLAAARAAVVPSRWENLPYTCIEAMATGLPVIATRAGGMAELIEDGHSGWLAESARPDHLAEALRRLLDTSPKTLAEMGCNAAAQIDRHCGNRQVIEAHRALQRQTIERGAVRSVHLPLNVLSRGKLPGRRPPRHVAGDSPAGIAILLTCTNDSGSLDSALQSIASQTRKPVAVVLACHGPGQARRIPDIRGDWPFKFSVLDEHYRTPAEARRMGMTALLDNQYHAAGVAIISDDVRLLPSYISVCESILESHPDVGLISCWSADLTKGKRGWVRPCPSFPYQWRSNDAAPFSVVRAEAIREVGGFRSVLGAGHDRWDLVNSVLAGGWIAVTVPAVLVQHPFLAKPVVESANADRAFQTELLGRFPDLALRDADDIERLSPLNSAKPSRVRAILADRLSRAKS